MSEKEEFLRLCAECVRSAKADDQRYYVTRGHNGNFVISYGSKDWLFTAFPGGRKILSIAGKAIVDG